MDQRFKEAWLRKLNSYDKRRYGLSDGDKERCVMATAYEAAVELEILPQCDLKGRDLLTDEELKAIGLDTETQYYLSTMNDTYSGSDPTKFPMRLITAVEKLPVREMVLIENKKDVVE